MVNFSGVKAFGLLFSTLSVSKALTSNDSAISSSNSTSSTYASSIPSISSTPSTSSTSSSQSILSTDTPIENPTSTLSSISSASSYSAAAAAASSNFSSVSTPSSSSNSTSATNTGPVPLFTPTDSAQSYRAAAICTSQALSYYSAQGTTVATNFAKIGDHTMVVPAGSTLTSIITGMDSYSNSVGVMTHPTFTFTVVGPTTTVWNDPAAYPVFDPFKNCCGYCRLPVFRPVIKYWPDTSKPSNTACLAGCSASNVLGGTTMGDNSTSPTSTPQQAAPTQYPNSIFPSYQSSTSTTPAQQPSQPAEQPSQPAAVPTQYATSLFPGMNPSFQLSTSSTPTPTPTLEPIPPQYSGVITARAEMSAAVIPRASDQGSLVYFDVDEYNNTYYSPYVYVMLQSVVAENFCNYVGGNYTSRIYSYLPGQLSTMQFRYGTSAAFNFDDLPCPPDSVRYANGWNDGSCSYQPFLAPMTQILQLDPAFQDCWIPGCNLWDPPHTLTPQHSMWLTADTPFAQPTPATPQPVVGSPAAVQTGNSGPQMTPQASMGVGDPNPPQGSAQPSNSVPNGVSDQGAAASSDASPQNQPDPQNTPKPTPVTFGSATIVLQSSNVIIGSQTIQPGSAITISGTQISLAPSATALVIGSSTIAIAPAGPAAGSAPTPTATALTVTVGGATYTLSATASDLVIGSQTLTPGGQAITQDGTTFSLQANGGDLVVGTSTIPLTQTTIGIGGIIYTAWAGPSASPGGPTASVMNNGTLVMTGDTNRLEQKIQIRVIIGLVFALGLWLY